MEVLKISRIWFVGYEKKKEFQVECIGYDAVYVFLKIIIVCKIVQKIYRVFGENGVKYIIFKNFQ